MTRCPSALALWGSVAALALSSCAENPVRPTPKLSLPGSSDEPLLREFVPILDLTDEVAERALRRPPARELVDAQIAAMSQHVREQAAGRVDSDALLSATLAARNERERLALAAIALMPYLDFERGEARLRDVAANAIAAKLGEDAILSESRPGGEQALVDLSPELRDGVGVLRLQHLSEDISDRVLALLSQWAALPEASQPRAILLDLSECRLAQPKGTTALFNAFAPGRVAFQVEYRDPRRARIERGTWSGERDWGSPAVARKPLYVWVSRASAPLVEAAVASWRIARAADVVVIGDRTIGSGRAPAWYGLARDRWFAFTVADLYDAEGNPLRDRPVYPDACPVAGAFVPLREPSPAEFQRVCADADASVGLEAALSYVAAAVADRSALEPAPAKSR